MFEHEGSAHTRSLYRLVPARYHVSEDVLTCSRYGRRTDEAAISAKEALSEVPAEEAEKAKDLRRRRMAAVGPYVMPEVRRGQG